MPSETDLLMSQALENVDKFLNLFSKKFPQIKNDLRSVDFKRSDNPENVYYLLRFDKGDIGFHVLYNLASGFRFIDMNFRVSIDTILDILSRAIIPSTSDVDIFIENVKMHLNKAFVEFNDQFRDASQSKTFVVNFSCPRCGLDHVEMVAYLFERPVFPRLALEEYFYDYWAMCPRNNEPVLIQSKKVL